MPTSAVSRGSPDSEPELLAEQLVILADGAVSRAMVLNDPDYGRHARAAAETLLDHAARRPRR
ncbi:hypothetical protein ACQPZZ_01545 [Microbispora sp. CA-135349]|uniref:hypothetical protein n=1 Tax=Microbispora sp. CA-135349 TaxID=3239953 RepID=UPI003D8F7312